MRLQQFESLPSSGWRLLAGSVSLVFLGGLLWFASEYRDRSAALDSIQSVGGVVICDPAPLWVSRVLGSSRAAAFDRVLGIRIPAQEPSAETLAESLEQLACFDELKSLDLSHHRLDANAAKRLRRLTSLTDLDLASTSVSDQDIRQLLPLYQLRNLCLADTGISDAGLGELVRIKTLESLNLDGTRVTDRGMRHLTRLPRLASLSVSNTAVTDEGLEPLGAILAAAISDD